MRVAAAAILSLWFAASGAYAQTGVVSGATVTATGSPTPRTLADRAADVVNAKDFGVVCDGSTNDSSALQALVTGMPAAGGEIVLPRGVCKLFNTLSIVHNGITIKGRGKTATILDFTAATAGSGIAMGPNFDWGIEGLTVRGAYLHGLSVATGEVAGDQAYAAYFRLRDVAFRDSRTGDGVRFGNAYMGELTGVRAQLNNQVGIRFNGYSTSLRVANSHAMNNGADGWRIENVSYSSFIANGADANTGYGYFIKDISGVTMLNAGAETNTKAMFGINFDSATANTNKGVYGLTIDTCLSVDNNTGGTSGGYLADFTTNSTASRSGHVSFRNCAHTGAPVGNSVGVAGSWIIDWAPNQHLNQTFSGGSFSTVGDGATATSTGLPVFINLGGSAICTVRSSVRNSVTTYGGVLVVTAASNNVASASRGATYVLNVSNNVTAGSLVSVISSSGNTTGATTDSASFTFTHDSATGNIFAIPVGSTASASFYFTFAAIGNLSVVPK